MNKELSIRILSSLILIPTVFFFIINGSFYFNIFILIVLSISLYEWHFLSYKKVYYLPGLVFIFFFILCFLFSEDRG